MNRELKTHLLWAFYIPSTLIATAWGLLIPVLPVYGGELTASYALLGVMLAGESIGRMLFDLPAGLLLRRMDTRKVMLWGLGLCAVAMALFVLVQNILWATLMLVFSGGGLAVYNIARHAYITQVTSAHVRGRAIALFGGVYRLGKFLGPVVGGWAAGTFGLRAAFGVFVLLTLATAYFVWRYMGPSNANAQTEHPYERAQFRRALREHRRVLATAGVGQIFAQLTRLGWIWAIPLYGANVLNLDVQVIGVVVGVGAALDALLFYSSGVLMDRYGRKWAIVPSFVGQAVGVLLIPFAGSALALAGASAVIGAANAVSSGTMMTLGGDLSPPESRSEFLGLWRFIGDIGFVGGPLVVGGVAQVLALNAAIFTVAGFGFGAALWFALLVPETLRQVRAAGD